MQRLVLVFAIAALLAGCASPERTAMWAPYDEYRPLCREYARQVRAQADEESYYRECIAYYVPRQADFPLKRIP